MERNRVTVSLDPELVEEIDNEAEQTDRSRSRVVEDRLRESVRRGASGDIQHRLSELESRVEQIDERIGSTTAEKIREKLKI